MDSHGKTLKIGILSIQGAFFEHKAALIKAFEHIIAQDGKLYDLPSLSLEVQEIRGPADLADLHGMIIPGGESTAMGKSLQLNEFAEKIREWICASDSSSQRKNIVWGTCGGLILLATHLDNTVTKRGGQVTIGGLDVTVSRNFFGRQRQSFEAPVDLKNEKIKVNPSDPLELMQSHGVFIRAPAVISCDKETIEILGTVKHPDKGQEPVVVAVKQDNIIGTSFHPELTEDIRWHTYFLRELLERKGTN